MVKKINYLIALIMMFSSVMQTFLGIPQVMAADYSVTYNGAVTYGPSTVR